MVQYYYCMYKATLWDVFFSKINDQFSISSSVWRKPGVRWGARKIKIKETRLFWHLRVSKHVFPYFPAHCRIWIVFSLFQEVENIAVAPRSGDAEGPTSSARWPTVATIQQCAQVQASAWMTSDPILSGRACLPGHEAPAWLGVFFFFFKEFRQLSIHDPPLLHPRGAVVCTLLFSSDALKRKNKRIM